MTKGMHCSGCANRLVSILKALEDITNVKANAKNGKEYDTAYQSGDD